MKVLDKVTSSSIHTNYLNELKIESCQALNKKITFKFKCLKENKAKKIEKIMKIIILFI